MATGSLAVGSWRHSFRSLVTNAAFVDSFGTAAFKLEEKWDFAIGAFTMADVKRDVT